MSVILCKRHGYVRPSQDHAVCLWLVVSLCAVVSYRIIVCSTHEKRRRIKSNARQPKGIVFVWSSKPCVMIDDDYI